MCGIAGIAAFANAELPTEEQLDGMLQRMLYRGPDEGGLEVADGVGIGMRRLSIIDLGGGSQPIYNEDGSIAVVFNGEIYNFKELRKELQNKGHVFETGTDTEVLVHAYEEYGDTFASRLNGMFAFALHDRNRHRLLIVRDQIGIKPLYYAHVNHTLIWGSELSVVMASGRVPRQLDFDALGDFLSWEYVPGSATLMNDVRKLEPAHMLVIEMERPVVIPQCYWRVEPGEDHGLSESEWIERLDAEFRRSVKSQMISDVPLGAFLSGGVDSSLAVSYMGDATTFSIGFEDPSYNELKWSERVAEHLGVDHHTRVLKPDIEPLFHELMRHMGDPIGDFSIFPTYLVSKLAREKVTVSLSGDGADELFAGYEGYYAQSMSARWLDSWGGSRLLGGPFSGLQRMLAPKDAKKGFRNKLKRLMEGMGHAPELRHARWRLFAGEVLRNRLLSGDAVGGLKRSAGAHITDLFEQTEGFDRINKLLYVDLKSYLVDNILTKVDRMSMAVSLEARVPYLDRDVVQMAFQVPGSLKLVRGETKSILKKVAERYIPRECLYRPKEGFSIPIKQWLKSTLRPLMESSLSPDRLRSQGIFDCKEVSAMMQQHLEGSANHSHVLWTMMVFQAWHREWMEGGK